MSTIRKNHYVLSRNILLVTTLLILSSTANAGVIEYNGYADLEFSLVSVTNQGSGDGPGAGAIRNAISSTGNIIDANTVSTGSGTATEVTGLISTDPWAIGGSFYQSSESFGKAGEAKGTSDAFADTGFSIFIENKFNSARTFVFSVFSFVSADVLFNGALHAFDDGGAYAEIVMYDNGGEFFRSSAEAFLGGSEYEEEYIESTVSFTLEADQSKTISGTVYSEGYAVAVAEPSILYVLCMGLLGLAGLHRRRPTSNYIKNEF
ncbi:MAG: hypothetical protein ACJA13_003959 [Paraglaciecola sp.]|jgi:hypothetical protein